MLVAHGLNERQIDALIRHGNPFVHVPFPFLLTGPSPARVPPRSRPATPVPARRQVVPAAARHQVPGRSPRRSGPAAAGRPVAPPVTAPRWPRAS